VRLNNPGNIERTKPRTPWQGAAPIAEAEALDPRFEVFTRHVWGIRAIARTLVTYQDRHNCRTVAQHIARWAPPVGRDHQGRTYSQQTYAYAAAVARAVGVGPDDPIDVTDYATALPMIRAIVRHENGSGETYGRPAHWYPEADYAEALRRAGIVPAAPPPLRQSESARAATVSATSAVALGAASVADHAALAPEAVEPVQQAAQAASPLAAPGSWLSIVLVLVIVGCSAYVVWRAAARRRRSA
jgi:hypothetical protein